MVRPTSSQVDQNPAVDSQRSGGMKSAEEAAADRV
jgi:hypothetical protein